MKQTTYLATLPKRSGKLLNSIMVSINAPTRIGHVTAGRNGGGIFIPPQLAEQVVKSSGSTHLRDVFGYHRLEEKKYTKPDRRAMDRRNRAGLSLMAKAERGPFVGSQGTD